MPLATRRLSNAFSNPSPQPLFLHRLCLNEYDSHPTAHTAVRAHTFARSNSCTVSILLVMTAAWRAFTPWGRLHMFKQNSPYRRRNESTSAAAPYQAAATRMFVMLSIDRLSKRPCGTHNTTAAHIQNSATRKPPRTQPSAHHTHQKHSFCTQNLHTLHSTHNPLRSAGIAQGTYKGTLPGHGGALKGKAGWAAGGRRCGLQLRRKLRLLIRVLRRRCSNRQIQHGIRFPCR